MTRPPRTNSDTTVNVTSVARIAAISEKKYPTSFPGRTPKTIITTPTTSAPIDGHKKLRFKLSSEVLRHASSGPTAVSNRSKRATGMATLLKKGGPTVTLVPCTHSERMGNSVPHSTVKHAITKSRLLNRKLDSRETSASSLCSLCRCERFFTKKKTQTAKMTAKNVMNQLPIDDWANACTELITPLRVKNVPKIERPKVAKISHMFHIFSIPRFSCIMTECRKAVPVSQGMSEAFSTGSQPQ